MPILNDFEKLTSLLYRQEIITLKQRELIRENGAADSKGRKRKPWRQRAASDKREKQYQAPLDLIESLKLDLGDGKILDEEAMMRAVAKEYKLVFKKLDPLELDTEVVANTIPKPFALKNVVVPLYRNGDVLTVAITDPEDAETIDQIKMVTGMKVDKVLSTRSDIKKIINQVFGFETTLKRAEEDASTSVAEIGNLEQLSHLKSEDTISSTDRHVQGAVDFILNYALSHRASDIHMEPKREETHIRMRIDGVLMETHKIPKSVHTHLLSRIKLLSRMDISEKRRPQDGRMKIKSDDQEVEMRVSVMPVAFGEKAVIRIFDPEMAFRELSELGFYTQDLDRYKSFLSKPFGMILVTGPTGSGKTSTLYSSLKYIAAPEKNIVTVEDPIEMVIPEYNQVGVQNAIDVTFASALRSILRQDPDIIMIGEIRDKETAENSVHAALTGHLLLSTMHTNDTVSSLTRLYDIGLEPYLVKSSLIGLAAQRLLRVVCGDCATDAKYSDGELRGVGIGKTSGLKMKKGKGCEKCRQTGYFGRTGVHEVLEVANDVREMIDGTTPNETIMKAARKAGTKILRENALKKMAEGITTLEEVLRLQSD